MCSSKGKYYCCSRKQYIISNCTCVTLCIYIYIKIKKRQDCKPLFLILNKKKCRLLAQSHQQRK